MTEPTYLACTKAPPADVPKAIGLGSCVAPRNHKGDCQYAWAGGVATVGRGPSPMERAEQIENLYRRARRHHLTALVCSFVSVVTSFWVVLHAFGARLP